MAMQHGHSLKLTCDMESGIPPSRITFKEIIQILKQSGAGTGFRKGGGGGGVRVTVLKRGVFHIFMKFGGPPK